LDITNGTAAGGLEGFVFDLEADNLYLQSKNIWTGHFKSLCGKHNLVIQPFREGKEVSRKKVIEYLKNFKEGVFVIGHNHLGYDLWMLWKFLGIPFIKGYKGKDYLFKTVVRFIDTFALSQFLCSDRFGGHSLAALSSTRGSYKIDFRARLIEDGTILKSDPKGEEFRKYHPYMEEYCDQDREATKVVFFDFSEHMSAIYGEYWYEHRAFLNHQKDHYLYAAQSFAGVRFKRERAIELVEEITVTMLQLEEEVLPQLPPRKLKKGEESFYSMPAKPFLASGGLSKTMLSWVEKHKGKVNEDNTEVEVYGDTYPIKAKLLIDMKLPMEIKDGNDIKQWFMEVGGWEPTFWNIKKGADGKPVRDNKGEPVKTSPKIQEMGNICPNLLEIDGELPKKIVKFLSLRNRRSVLEGWLKNWRLDFDGRLSGKITGYTPTFRVCHQEVTNVPKAQKEVLLGEEFRDLFYVDEGNWFVGTDATALENRTLGHYTYRYDGGDFAKLMLEGDPHTASAFAFFPEETEGFDKDDPDIKENPKFKPFRNGGKTGNYLLAYGGSANKLGKSLGLSKERGQVAYDNYWKLMVGLKGLKDALENHWEHKGKKRYIPAIDGRFLGIRSKHVLINCAGQSCGAIVMSMAACLVDEKLGGMRNIDELGRPYYNYKGNKVKRILMVHDEYSFESEGTKEFAEELAELTRQAIIQAGVDLNLRLDLDGEGKVGKSWKEVH